MVDEVDDVEWKVWDTKRHQWIFFASCGKSMNCNVFGTKLLPKGIRVLNVANGSLTLQSSAMKNTNGQARLLCTVHTRNRPVNYDVKFNFTACIRTQIAADVNLTKVMRNMLPWEQVVDVEMYNANGYKFGYCNTQIGCRKSTDGNHLVPVLWNRLQLKRDSLLLTGIKKSDDRLEIRVKVHLSSSSDDTKVKSTKAIGGIMETVRMYTLRILVGNNSESRSQGPKSARPTTQTDSFSLPSHRHTGSTTGNGASAAHGQLWTVAAIIALRALASYL